MKKLGIIIVVSLILLTACSKTGSLTPTPTPGNSATPQETEATPVGDDSDTIEVVAPTDNDITNPSPLTGLELEGKYQPIAVMIENEPASRPYSGIIDADVVYEAHTEGGLSRFMAIFNSKIPSKVGPIRSVRHYYLWMAREWDAYLVHYGQSFIAAERFDTIDVKRLNGLYADKLFWRDDTRKAPHNAYIDLNKVKEKIDFDQKAVGFAFTSENKREGSPYESVSIPYNSSSALVEYKYDENQKLNMRYINGKKDVEKETGKQLFAKNVIVQYAEHSILEPGAGYRDVALIGSGKAQYFMEGKWLEGTWKRKSAEERTIFYDSDQKEMEFLRGNTWIEVVQIGMKVTVN